LRRIVLLFVMVVACHSFEWLAVHWFSIWSTLCDSRAFLSNLIPDCPPACSTVSLSSTCG